MNQKQKEPPPSPDGSLVGKKILIINTGSLKKRFILKRIKQLGIKAIVAHKEKNWASNYVEGFIITDTTKVEESVATILEYLKDHPVDGIVTFWEDDVTLWSKLIEKTDHIGIPYAIAKKARNKYLFRKFLKTNHLSGPNFASVKNYEDLKILVEKLHFPVVIKPVLGTSSAYVIKANDYQELLDIYAYLKNNITSKAESALHESLDLMVEEYIDGDEVDIDILLQNGKIKYYSISDNFQTKEPFFVETGQAIPSGLSDQQQHELINMAEEVLEKLGIMNGCIHFEAKYSSHGPVPIEINLRMGGDEVYSFVKGAWKMDLIEGACKIACGIYLPKITRPAEPFVYLSGKYFLPDKSGVISNLRLPKKFPKNLQVEEFNFFKEVGDSVFAPPAGYEFLGWMTVKGENLNDARDNLDEAMNLVEATITPFSGVSSLGKSKRSTAKNIAYVRQSDIQAQAKLEKLKYITRKNLRKLKIAVATNSTYSPGPQQKPLLNKNGLNIIKALRELGYVADLIDFDNFDQALEQIRANNIDLIFNEAEQLFKTNFLEAHIAMLFDIMQIPYTGSSSNTLMLCDDKIRVKKLLDFHKIPTPRWDYMFSLDDELRDDLQYPLIVKPASFHGSIGIHQESVVYNKKQLEKQLLYVFKQLKRSAIVEEYLPGDEYDVCILGNADEEQKILPLARTIYDKLPSDMAHISSFELKYEQLSQFDKLIERQKPPKNVSKKILSFISEIALDAYNICDVHDYGRVEIKMDKNDNPYVLEVNPNPDLNPSLAYVNTAKLVNIDYPELLEEIMFLTIKRYRSNQPFAHLIPSSY